MQQRAEKSKIHNAVRCWWLHPDLQKVDKDIKPPVSDYRFLMKYNHDFISQQVSNEYNAEIWP